MPKLHIETRNADNGSLLNVFPKVTPVTQDSPQSLTTEGTNPELPRNVEGEGDDDISDLSGKSDMEGNAEKESNEKEPNPNDEEQGEEEGEEEEEEEEWVDGSNEVTSAVERAGLQAINRKHNIASDPVSRMVKKPRNGGTSKPTAEQKTEWKNKGKEVVKNQAFLEQAALSAALNIKSKKQPYWNESWSIFFMVCKAINEDPFKTISTTKVEKVRATPDYLLGCGWKIPQLGKLPEHLIETINGAYEVLQEQYNSSVDKIQEKMSFRMSDFSFQEDGMSEQEKQYTRMLDINFITHKTFPDNTIFLSAFQFCRDLLNKVLECTEGAKDADMRPYVLWWIYTNLRDCTEQRHMREKVKQYCTEGIAKLRANHRRAQQMQARPSAEGSKESNDNNKDKTTQPGNSTKRTKPTTNPKPKRRASTKKKGKNLDGKLSTKDKLRNFKSFINMKTEPPQELTDFILEHVCGDNDGDKQLLQTFMDKCFDRNMPELILFALNCRR